MEFLEEFIDQVILENDDPNIDVEFKDEKPLFEENILEGLPSNDIEVPVKSIKSEISQQFDVKPVKRSAKRKTPHPAKKPKTEPKKYEEDETITTGQVIKLYAYKDCLGKYDSLVKNPDMPLWFRDNGCLFQKYLRQRFDDGGLYYYSTQIYSCWEKDRESDYLELEAVAVMRQGINYIVKILDVELIEEICLNGNFKDLGLTPYTNYQMRSSAKQDPKIYTIKISDNDDTSNDVQADVKEEISN